MAYNNIGYLKRCRRIQEIVKEHYIAGVTSYRAIWRMFIYPVYFIGYADFMYVIGEGDIDNRIKEIENKLKENRDAKKKRLQGVPKKAK